MHPLLQTLVRPHYRDLAGYVSAGMAGKDQTKIFMNANESPFTLPGLDGLNQYPEPQPPALVAALAGLYGVRGDQIVVTRGADESIAILGRVFCEPHRDSVLIHPPTFGVYEVYTGSMACGVVKVPLLRDGSSFRLDVDGIVAAVQSNSVKIVYLCSPNNPTGGSFPKAELLKICKAVEDKCAVVLDQAYAEFSKEGSLAGHLADHPNLIILRTMSKAYGFAGGRIGAMLCADADFMSLVKTKAMETYPLTRPSITAALKALAPENRTQVERNIKTILSERDRLKTYFESSPRVKRVYDSDANFLLVEVEDAKGLWASLNANGFVVRDFSSHAGTQNCLRISPAKPEDNDRFMELWGKYA